MKKIVHISNIPSPYQIEWAKELKKNYDVEFWFMTDIQHSVSGRPSYWNVEMPHYCRILPSKFQKGELCYGPTLNKELKNFNPDIIMLQGAWYMISWFQAYRWGVKNSKKIIVGPTEFNKTMNKFLTVFRNKIIFGLLYSKIDLFFANAYIHYDYLLNTLNKKNVVLFMNYDNYSKYLRHEVRKDNSVITFMYGGAISRRMRVPELLKVFKKIVSKHENVRLVIGGYGPEKKFCKEIVNSSKRLSNTVTFHDVKTWDEISDVYKNCSVLINFASYSPGAGVILSAVASGMGIISSISVNSSRHFVINKFNGYMVETEKELFAAMETYASNPSIINLHSKRSKEIGNTTLSFKEHLYDFNQVIKNL